ncbi:MAG: hypothetical protein JNM72_22160 [Deltaproteobacteria bacterium]|nr:hypothetical protein [Deltaproteobacteria bacterium]
MRPRSAALLAPRMLLCLAALAGCDDDDDTKDSGVDDGCGGDDCGDDAGADDAGGDDAGADDAGADDAGGDEAGDGGDDDSGGDDGVPSVQAEVSGTITVQLTQLDSGGDIQPLAWEDSPFVNTDGSITWPYGKIFVGGYAEPSPGLQTYVGTAVVPSPAPVNPYTLPIVMAEEGEILVYASLDEDGDDIVGSQDPVGVWPLRIPITEGLSLTSVDIVIQVLVTEGGGGSDGGGGGESVTISGEALVTAGYSASQARVMLVNLDGTGPIASTRATLSSTGAGSSDVSGPYTMEVPAYLGQRNLVGAIDSNGNSMIDPADTWGATTLALDVDGNPILIGNTDLVDYPVQIPLGDGPGISVIPFVQLSGTITGWSDPLVAMTAGDVYVTALKYRQNAEFNLLASTADFDTKQWAWAADNLGVELSKPYTLLVPANSVVYLWGYGDPDAGGLVNQTLEPVASVGVDGRIVVGTTNISGLDLTLSIVD